jgi:hypothetical protein
MDPKQSIADWVVDNNHAVARKLTAMKYGITEDEVLRRVDEEGPEGDEVANCYWSILDEFIKVAERS